MRRLALAAVAAISVGAFLGAEPAQSSVGNGFSRQTPPYISKSSVVSNPKLVTIDNAAHNGCVFRQPKLSKPIGSNYVCLMDFIFVIWGNDEIIFPIFFARTLSIPGAPFICRCAFFSPLFIDKFQFVRKYLVDDDDVFCQRLAGIFNRSSDVYRRPILVKVDNPIIVHLRYRKPWPLALVQRVDSRLVGFDRCAGLLSGLEQGPVKDTQTGYRYDRSDQTDPIEVAGDFVGSRPMLALLGAMVFLVCEFISFRTLTDGRRLLHATFWLAAFLGGLVAALRIIVQIGSIAIGHPAKPLDTALHGYLGGTLGVRIGWWVWCLSTGISHSQLDGLQAQRLELL
jgi:hypothetical protein